MGFHLCRESRGACATVHSGVPIDFEGHEYLELGGTLITRTVKPQVDPDGKVTVPQHEVWTLIFNSPSLSYEEEKRRVEEKRPKKEWWVMTDITHCPYCGGKLNDP